MNHGLGEQIVQLTIVRDTRYHMAKATRSEVEAALHMKWVDFFSALIVAKTLELALETAADYLGGNHES